MATLTKRVQVLFSEDQWRELQRIAEQQEHSVGHLVREAVAQTYLTPNQESVRRERREAVEKMVRMNLPVDDWKVMEREATSRSFFDEMENVNEETT